MIFGILQQRFFISVLICILFSISSSKVCFASPLKGIDLVAVEKEIRDSLQKNPDKSFELSKKYLDYGIDNEIDSLIGKAYYFLGLSSYFTSKYHLSNGYYDNALKTNYAKQNPAFAEKCWNNRGINFDILNIFDQSFISYKNSLKFAEQLGDSTSIAQTWINIGLLDFKSKNHERGKETTEKALDYFSRKKDTLHIALCYQNLSKERSDKGDYQEAINLALKSLALHKVAKNEYGEASVLYAIGDDYFHMGNHDAAEPYLRSSEAIATANGFDLIRANNYSLWAEIERKRGDYTKAESYFNTARKMYESMDDLHALSNTYLSLANFYSETDRHEKHVETISAYKEAREKLLKRVSLSRYDELQVLYEHDKQIDIIDEQRKKLRLFKLRIAITTTLVVLLLILLAIIVYLYLNVKNYSRSLFKSNIAQMKMKLQQPETATVSNAENVRMAELYHRILDLMERQDFYKRPDLSIAQISDELATNDKYISQAINTFSNSNFNAFVNNYRINEARRLMVEQGHKLLVKEIADMCGFRNLNTFHKKFKEITGLTPSMFMDMILEQRLNTETNEEE